MICKDCPAAFCEHRNNYSSRRCVFEYPLTEEIAGAVTTTTILQQKENMKGERKEDENETQSNL